MMLSILSKVAAAQQCCSTILRSTSVSLSSSHYLNTSSAVHQNQPANKVVFISQSTDVFSNLAFEAWLYKNWNFSQRQLLLLWRNAPCVVIGRHQNPYIEANLPYLDSAHVPLARRYSGGGTVYHDHGNLNCTFFSDRGSYNRRWNLELICEALRSDFNVDVQLNSRDDILLNQKLKVSGSAAKLGRETAYHHCTLLVDVERSQLGLALEGDKQIKSTATASVVSSVGNISDAGQKGKLTVDSVLNSLASHYLEAALPNQQQDPSHHRLSSHGITLINPQDDWFPGLGELRDELISWDWMYGKTPRFTKSVRLSMPEYRAHDDQKHITVNLSCQRGLVQDVTVEDSCDTSQELQALVLREVRDAVRGTPYTAQLPGIMDTLLRLSHHHHHPAAATGDTLKI